MVLAEANQRGIPVISSDCKSGPKDIVIPGRNGYLYKEGDINDFIRVISGVMDGKLQFDTPENIAKTAERFRDDIVISNIYNFLKNLIKENT
jgi:UDP-D-galactose:(glucosyl)LPS alpha-1,6-D-galactosyltransferase